MSLEPGSVVQCYTRAYAVEKSMISVPLDYIHRLSTSWACTYDLATREPYTKNVFKEAAGSQQKFNLFVTVCIVF
ncbi:hypothetical protein RchiOBHm_Chr1g0373661 [Rosa chinensis]|uniref:Uncharacterized protein n=1 Tax=Rosa chinensis TaxID=74649 RepID=A0A2P6SM59_ROSCH|nr:hypothetical protein RchiOBHm_Chr1g0373661 [Rosa chinensis]